MAKSALFLVQTPLHMQNALEAINVFNIKTSTFFIVNSIKNTKWLQQINSLVPDNSETILCVRDDVRLELCVREYIFHINILKSREFDFVFFGDARLYIFVDCVNMLSNKNTYLMDDGSGTILTMHTFEQFGSFYDLPLSSLPSRRKEIAQIRKNYGLDLYPPVGYDLFTIYDYKSTDAIKVVQNPMLRLRFDHRYVDQNKVLLIGQPLANSNYFSVEEYADCVTSVNRFFQNKSVHYLPHPRESSEVLSLVSKIKDLTVIDTELTVERYLISSQEAPFKVCGFYSTALWNIAKFQTGIDVTSFKLSPHRFRPEVVNRKTRNKHVTDMDAIDLYYAYYKKRMKVVEGIA